MYNLIERLAKIKKEFLKTDFTDCNNKIDMYAKLCDLEQDMKIYDMRNMNDLAKIAKAARRTCEEDS